MKIIGLTGNMCSGKSTAARFFFQLNYAVISADSLAKLVLKNPSTIQAISQTFGKEVLEQGQVCFAKLAKKSFSSRANVAKLNSIMHPKISQEFLQEVKKLQKNNHHVAIIYDAPLLFESGAYQLVDKIILMLTSYGIILKRWQQRVRKKNISFQESDLQDRIKYQIPAQRAKQMSDFVIDGNQDLPQIKAQVFKIHQQVTS